ncbi:MAG: hypothetical protein II723_05045 [Oscillospiraceae bacterium]|nr:hypothetical protein [Oscillospiraceae bacterium]
MPKCRQLAALASAVLLLTGCDPADLFLSPEDSAAMISDHTAQRYRTEDARRLVTDLQAAWTTDDAEAVRSLTDRLIGAVDDASAVYLTAEMQYYADWNNKDLSALHDQTLQDFFEVSEMARWAFTNGLHKSQYKELFEPLADAENADYYLSTGLSRVCSAARSEATDSSARLDEYYQTAYGEDSDSETTDEACAALYLDTIGSMNTDDLRYGYYVRDYTPEDVSAAYREICKDIVPLYQTLRDSIESDSRYSSLSGKKYAVKEPFSEIRKYAAQISPRLAESAEKLTGESLCTVASGDSCYDGSYTVSFPKEQTARIYFYQGNDCFDFTGAVHEFGHFHADWHDRTPTLLQRTCIDLAEIQSQGLEMLYTHFYGDLYGKDAGYLEQFELLNMVDSVVTGFAVGEFEREVMQQKDTLTAEEVVGAFRRRKEETGFSLELGQVTHLYEQPGYYISYGVSALAALQIYAEMTENFEAGAALYEKIAETPALSGEHRLMRTLNACGFDNPFSADSIHAVSEHLAERIRQLNAA